MDINEGYREFKQEYENDKKKVTRKSWSHYCSIDLVQLLKEFVQWYSTNKGVYQTAIKKACKVRRFFKDTGLELSQVTKEERKAHRAYLLKQVEGGVLKKNYVSTILTDLNVFFCHFLQKPDLRVAGIGKEEIYCERLTREEYSKMLAEVENRKDIGAKKKKLHKVLLVFFWNELPRTSEGTKNLMLGDIKERQREVLLHSGKRDKVPMHLRTPLATQEFLDAWEEYKEYRDSKDWRDEAPAFVQVKNGGRSVSPDFMRRLVKEYAARAGIQKRVFPYLFRKSGGTEIAMKNPKLAQIQLGHSNIKTTLANYVIPNREERKNIEQYLNPDRAITPEKIATELVKRYLSCDAAHEKELVFALKALKIETDKKEKGDKFDVAFS